MTIRVFVQNEAGSSEKHVHDEKTLTFRYSRPVAHAYPFPYGFVIGTDAGDGDNVDCFVITGRALRTGQIIECEPIGLMEQFEDGVVDHNVRLEISLMVSGMRSMDICAARSTSRVRSCW